jgi:hypothetical protein
LPLPTDLTTTFRPYRYLQTSPLPSNLAAASRPCHYFQTFLPAPHPATRREPATALMAHTLMAHGAQEHGGTEVATLQVSRPYLHISTCPRTFQTSTSPGLHIFMSLHLQRASRFLHPHMLTTPDFHVSIPPRAHIPSHVRPAGNRLLSMSIHFTSSFLAFVPQGSFGQTAARQFTSPVVKNVLSSLSHAVSS